MGSTDEFHREAHPDAREITGNRQYGEWGQCIVQAKTTDERCRGHAKGPHGKCHHHGGATPTAEENPAVGNGDQDDNTNAVTHAQFAERTRFYRKVMDNPDRELCDAIYRNLDEEFHTINGTPRADQLTVMWQIAVEHIQFSHGDNWLADRPESLDSGNAMVDKETHYTEDGTPYYRYNEAVPVGTKLKLRKEHRAWLKDNGMLNDPESQKADAMSGWLDQLQTATAYNLDHNRPDSTETTEGGNS